MSYITVSAFLGNLARNSSESTESREPSLIALRVRQSAAE
jgi:hypothetical protein